MAGTPGAPLDCPFAFRRVTAAVGRCLRGEPFIPTGDFDGNGTVDFAARRTDGTLYLYEGDGHGGFAGTRIIGRGWQTFSSITAVGDWDGDGAPDLLAR